MITLNQFQTAEQLNEFASSFIDYENPKLQVFTNITTFPGQPHTSMTNMELMLMIFTTLRIF